METAREITAEEMAALRHEDERSSEWPRVRADHLQTHPNCAACGKVHDRMEVHHKVPFHLDPGGELDPDNLITLCMHPAHVCHLIFGHLLDYRAYNPSVESDAAAYLAAVKNRPYSRATERREIDGNKAQTSPEKGERPVPEAEDRRQEAKESLREGLWGSSTF